jgi:RimJ/RimL family protein N-acetyltransferase
MADQPWPKAERLGTERLTLEPLRVANAAEMADVLNDPGLHTFTGGSSLTEDELRKRYESLTAGQSPQGHEGWLNWVVRRRDTGEVIGYVQATVERDGDDRSADLAWVIGTEHQHCGLATAMAVAGAQDAIPPRHENGLLLAQPDRSQVRLRSSVRTRWI